MTAPPLLEVRGLAHRYGRRVVLDGVDLRVEAGRLVGVSHLLHDRERFDAIYALSDGRLA